MASIFKRKIKKRYWVFALIILEIACIPLSAKLVTQLDWVKPRVISSLIDEIPGRKRYAVASEQPFYLTADDFEGRIVVSAQNEKTIGVVTFGENAQTPNPSVSCSHVKADNQIIYQSETGTILRDGHIATQAIVITVYFKTSTSPKIDFKDGSPQLRNSILDNECPTNVV